MLPTRKGDFQVQEYIVDIGKRLDVYDETVHHRIEVFSCRWFMHERDGGGFMGYGSRNGYGMVVVRLLWKAYSKPAHHLQHVLNHPLLISP